MPGAPLALHYRRHINFNVVVEYLVNRLACARIGVQQLGQKVSTQTDAINTVMRTPVIVRAQCNDVPLGIRPLFR